MRMRRIYTNASMSGRFKIPCKSGDGRCLPILGAVLLCLSSACLGADVEFSAEYTADILANVSGGIDQGTRYVDNLNLDIDVDVPGVFGLRSGTIHVHGLYNNGARFSEELVGDLQVTSNIDADEAWRIFEFWYEFAADDWSVRTGLYDLNSEFDANEAGGIFLNSSHGIGAELAQTGENGPSIFPISSLSLRAAFQAESFTIRAAILDAVPGDPDDSSSNKIRLDSDEGWLTIAEIDIPVTEASRLWAGYWRYTAEFEQPFGDGPDKPNDGWYVGYESRFSIGSHAASGFVRYGQAEDRVNLLRDYAGAGIRLEGLFASRPEDQIGVAVASAGAGGAYRDFLARQGEDPGQRETTWELTYLATVNEHFAVQPNIQYVQDPSIAGYTDDAWVVGLRLIVGL